MICISLNCFLSTSLPLTSTFLRNYRDQVAHFEMKRNMEDVIDLTEREEADDFLNSVRVDRENLRAMQLDTMKKQRENGQLTRGTTDDELYDFASKAGDQMAAINMLSNPPTVKAAQFLERQIQKVQDPRGARFSRKHGNLSRASAATQRSRNTGINDAHTVHNTSYDDSTDDEQLEKDTNRATKNSILDTGEVDPDDMEHAMRESLDMASKHAARSQNQKQSSCPLPMKSPEIEVVELKETAVVAGKTEETPAEIVDVRDEAIGQVLVMQPSDSAKHHQVLSDLTRPYDPITTRANTIMFQKGKSTEERVDGLLTLVEGKMQSGSEKKKGTN